MASRQSKAERLAKLAELKRAREGGKREYKVEEPDTIYYEVSEHQYKSIVKGRLAQDDFVVDDGCSGYVDTGVDDFEEAEDMEEDEDELPKNKSKKAKGNPKGKTKAKPKPPPPAVTTSIAAYRPAVSAEKESDFMADILGDMDNIAAKPTPRPRKRKPEPDPVYDDGGSSPSPFTATRPSRSNGYGYGSSDPDMSSDPYFDDGVDASSGDDMFMSPRKKPKTETPGITPAIDRIAKLDVQSESEAEASFDDIDMDAFMSMDDEDFDMKPAPKMKMEVDSEAKPLMPTNGNDAKPDAKKKLDDNPSWLSVYDSLTVAGDDSFGPAASTSAATRTPAPSNISVLEEDGSLRFYWLDYLEHEGKLYFIGKTQDKKTKVWVSICVTVENLERNLFVLPRERQMEEDEYTGEMVETDVVPTLLDIYSDFDRLRKKARISQFKAKFVKRKYAFGEKDVPTEARDWLKVIYPFTEPPIPNTASSPNFSRIFGTNTSAFELLVLKRKIMGPCWLQIKKPEIDNKGVSWCKVEATVSDPKDINPFAETDDNAPRDTPPLTVVSLSLRTIVNHRENNREIVCATSRIWSSLNIDDPTPPESLPCTVRTFVRPLDRFPPNFEARASNNGKGVISPMKNERMLLNSLLVTLHKADPDVIVGHEFLGVSLDVLLHRMRELKADHWSRIGRFRRSKWPNIGRQGTNLRFLSGRLLCDLASDGAKGMITSTTWSLTEMCKTHLDRERQDIDFDDTANYFDGRVSSPESLLNFVRHCELDAHYQMALGSKVQLLPLTRQLTNLAGNSWNKTLNGGRAERNEYILLHEFHRLKYICPDKLYGKKAVTAVKAEREENEDGGAPKPTKGKKDKYKGGLVFDPKRGLWDKYILVMDFNSLYPSIIQEYNIDFTTVEPVEDEEGEEKIPEPPSSQVGQGVLPRLIATLVSRRRAVKALMKDKKATQAQLLQWDIKQMALKLTANSMYGCLGFEYSRFYARPLAALTTFKGREILTHTRELAESMQLDVVYGDTDSVFVNSNVTDLAEALKISAEFKKAVNDRYKLLEIDLDGIFKRLLLLQKKKYAAVKVEDSTRTSTEVKGLDMKRREYCALSKTISGYVLDQILSGEATETVVENIHEYLTTVGQDVRAGKMKLDEFIIHKRLGKNPEDYPDAKSQPHVQVALRTKAKGGTARAGDVIPYIFCLGEGGETAKTAQADRARSPEEIRRESDKYKIDYEHYLSQQILPPIERLCEPIEGTDRARLAECLGLDPNRYRTVTVGESDERYFGTLDSLMSDAQRFKDADPFNLRCRSCQNVVPFAPLSDREKCHIQPRGNGLVCPQCRAEVGIASVQAQLEVQIREHIAKYYESWTVCDDATCGHRTRMMGVYGRRCLRPGCRGSVAFEYPDAQLYNQLRYYASLFDIVKAAEVATGATKEALDVLLTLQRDPCDYLKAVVEKYFDQCGRRWVQMNTLFSFMKL